MKQFSFSYDNRKETLSESDTLRAIAFYREDVLLALVKFVTYASVGDKIDVKDFNYIYAPIIERIK